MGFFDIFKRRKKEEDFGEFQEVPDNDPYDEAERIFFAGPQPKEAAARRRLIDFYGVEKTNELINNWRKEWNEGKRSSTKFLNSSPESIARMKDVEYRKGAIERAREERAKGNLPMARFILESAGYNPVDVFKSWGKEESEPSGSIERPAPLTSDQKLARAVSQSRADSEQDNAKRNQENQQKGVQQKVEYLADELKKWNKKLLSLEKDKEAALSVGGSDASTSYYDDQIRDARDQIRFIEEQIVALDPSYFSTSGKSLGAKADTFFGRALKKYISVKKTVKDMYGKKKILEASADYWSSAKAMAAAIREISIVAIFLLIVTFTLQYNSAQFNKFALWFYWAYAIIFFILKLMQSKSKDAEEFVGDMSRWSMWILWVFTAKPFFNNWTSFLAYTTIALVIYVLYQYGDKLAFIVALIMPTLAIVFLVFLFSGWGIIFQSKAADVETQIGASETLDKTAAALKNMLDNIWTLISNPTEWYQRQFIQKGERAEGDTSAALEFTAAQVIPGSAYSGETMTVQSEIENKGKEIATSVFYKLELDGRAQEHGGRVLMEQQPVDEWIYPAEKRILISEFTAPTCTGTFSAIPTVDYNYTVVAGTNIELIPFDLYTELATQRKLVLKSPLSVTSAGPFKITLNTDRQQPIPVDTNDTPADNPRKFKLFLSIINERDGTAKVYNNTVEMPKEFVPIKPYSQDDPTSCQMIHIAENTDSNVYSLADGSGSQDLDYIPEQAYRIFPCEITYAANEKSEPLIDSKTFFVKTSISYTYHVKKKALFTIRTGGGQSALTCEEVEAHAPRGYMNNMAVSCGGGDPNVDHQRTSLEGWYAIPKSGSSIESKDGDDCNIYGFFVKKDQFYSFSRTQGSNAPADPITDLAVACDDNNDYDKDGNWTKAEPLGDPMAKQAVNPGVFGTSDCYLYFKRGKSNPVNYVRMASGDAATEYESSWKKADGPGMETHGNWDSNGYIFYKQCTDPALCPPLEEKKADACQEGQIMCENACKVPFVGPCPEGTTHDPCKGCIAN